MIEKLSNITTTGAPDKRKMDRMKTEGEKRFDWAVYGGIGWVVNAVISVFATDQLYNNKSINGWFNTNVVDKLKNAKWNMLEQKWPGFTKEGIFSATLCIGGTLLVPVMKYYEDRKSKIVRKWDEEIYGKEHVQNDAAIQQAHIDMDHAPKQSWLSMWSARAAVIGIAYGMGKTMGASDSMLGKALDGTPLKSVGTLERIGASTTRTIVKVSDWITQDLFKMKTTSIMDKAIAKAHPHQIQANEHRALIVGQTTGYELAQSGTIALMFYGISKSIAGLFGKPEASPRHIPTPVALDAAARRQRDGAESTEKPQPEPQNTVSSVSHEAKVEHAPGKGDPMVAA